jgi:hypothetical protein
VPLRRVFSRSMRCSIIGQRNSFFGWAVVKGDIGKSVRSIVEYCRPPLNRCRPLLLNVDRLQAVHLLGSKAGYTQ